jgi:hypothetical protein
MTKRRPDRPNRRGKDKHSNHTPSRGEGRRKSTLRLLAATIVLSVAYIVGFLIYSVEVVHSILESAPGSWLALLALSCVLIFLIGHVWAEIRTRVGAILAALGEGAEGSARRLKDFARWTVAGSAEFAASRREKYSRSSEDSAAEPRGQAAVRSLWTSTVALAIIFAMCAEVPVDPTVDAAPSGKSSAKLGSPNELWPVVDITAGWPLPLASAKVENPPMPRVRPSRIDKIKLARQHAPRINSASRRSAPPQQQEFNRNSQTLETFAPSPPLPQICILPFAMFMSPEELRGCGFPEVGVPPSRTSANALY